MTSQFRLERRLDAEPRLAALTRIAGAGIALVVAGLFLLLTGRNPFTILFDALDAVFGEGRRGLEGVGLRAIPILMCALGVALSLRMRIWNIGSDGQFLMGAFAAVGVAIHWDGPHWLVLIVMSLVATAAGALWILIPAFARVYWNVNEIITTLLLNFVAVQIVAWASLSFWRDEKAQVVQSTPPVEPVLAKIPGLDSLTLAVLVPLIIAGVFWWLFRSTTIGYEIDTIGGNPRAATFAGINVTRRMLAVMLVTGAIAGLGGMLQLSAPGAQRLNSGFSAQYGLSGFIVASLAGGSFIGLLAGGFFIAAMFYSGLVLQTKGLSTYIVFAIYGIILLGIAIGEVAARYRLVRVEHASVELGGGGHMIVALIDNAFLSLISTAIPASAVVLLAATGAMVGERVGVLNLGQEGLIGIGAVYAVIAVSSWSISSPWAALLIGMIAAGVAGVIFALAVAVFRANQVLAGLALALGGIGLSNQLGTNRNGTPINTLFTEINPGGALDNNEAVQAFFFHDPMVYLAYIVIPLVLWFLLFRTRHGLNMRAVGENPAAADAVGVNVTMARLGYTILGAMLSGAGGAYMVLSFTPTWSPDIARGRGWIALAVVIFAAWRPFGVVAGALLYGAMTSLGPTAQARRWDLPFMSAIDLSFFLSMLPYLVTLIAILIPAAAATLGRRVRSTQAPGALATPYSREDR